MHCAKCQSHRMRRIVRVGFLRKVLAPIFGYYPWRCSACLTEVMLHSRGKKRRSAHDKEKPLEQV
jgi:hypothetical protein